MKIVNWTNIRLVLIFAMVIFLYSFTSTRNSQRKLKHSEVIFIGESKNFIKPETVNKLLIENNEDVKTIKKDEVNLNRLEKSIDKHPMIQKSDVFVTVDGVLKVRVLQKKPIARYVDSNQSFYIDSQGNKMPLSENFTDRVPLISGEIELVNKEKLTTLLNQIYQDKFLNKSIIGLQITAKQEVLMTNRSNNFIIVFGKLINTEKKIKNYKAFLQKTISDSMVINKYKKIDLRFTNQVIGIK